MSNAVVSTVRRTFAALQERCTFIMARHLFVHRRLIDQFLTASRVARYLTDEHGWERSSNGTLLIFFFFKRMHRELIEIRVFTEYFYLVVFRPQGGIHENSIQHRFLVITAFIFNSRIPRTARFAAISSVALRASKSGERS